MLKRSGRSLWTAALALVATAAWANAADDKAVKPCQDEIRNKIKAKHADAKVNFESVETKVISPEVTGVKGKLDLRLGDSGNTMNYTCRVDMKEMKVVRAEWGKENK
jgi:hypothetical protein